MPRRAARMSDGRQAAVVFADDNEWSCFFELAAELRRAGFATIRVTSGRPRGRIGAAAFRVLFDHTIAVPAGADAVPAAERAALAVLADTYTFVDIQTTETLAKLIYGFAADLPAPHRTHRWATRLAVTDKATVSDLLGAAGVRVPPILLATDVSPAEAASRLGLPLVVKERVGCGGAGVHFAHSLPDLERLVDASGEADRFYESFKSGEHFAYGVLAVDDGAVVARCGYSVTARTSATAPPAAIEKVLLPELDAVADAVVAAGGLVGLMSLNLIRDDDGAFWLHDVNPRAFGSMATCAHLGVSFGPAYIRWLGADGPQPPSRGRPAPHAVIFPDALRRAGRGTYPLAAAGRWLAHAYRTCGAGYVAIELVRNRPFPRRG